jgi:hypothetical protein
MKKKRDASSSSCASMVSKVKSKKAQEDASNSIPLLLNMEQLIRLGRDCGFDDRDEEELVEAAHMVPDCI